VLGELSADERKAIEDLLDPMSEAVEAWLQEGVEIAMTRFNR
jgi:peptidyl-tRNA hydrolase